MFTIAACAICIFVGGYLGWRFGSPVRSAVDAEAAKVSDAAKKL